MGLLICLHCPTIFLVSCIILVSLHNASWYTVSAQLVGPGETSHCWVPCRDSPSDSDVAVPGTDCKDFYVCREGRVTNRLTCSGGRAFDANLGVCNHESFVVCVDPACPPTLSPSESPTESPTPSPSTIPTASPTPAPSYAIELIKSKQYLIELHVLKSYTTDGIAYPSIKYTFNSFFESLIKMGIDGFGADFKFMLWDHDGVKFRYGLVNVAAFLANAMVEAVYDDTCDELNWQQVAGRYALSNSCGMEGRNYQEESCGIYSCIVDPSMEVTAVSSANQVRAPPPMECRPGSGPSGYWDKHSGTEVKNTPYANTAGRIDVEGCCYWGRGVLLTRGACNIGKLNYYLGARAAREGRQSLYPTVDFCADPEATCASSVTEELRWTTALFEWSERVQRYESDDWNYEDQLTAFLDEGLDDDNFIESVNRIFTLGCHTVGCSDREVRFNDRRKSNFYVIVNEVFAIGSIKIATRAPTRMPTLATSRPTSQTNVTPQVPLGPQPAQPDFLCIHKPNGFVSISACTEYVECYGGKIVSRNSCPEGTIFDSSIDTCNWAFSMFDCDAPTSAPTTRKPTPQQFEPLDPSPGTSQQQANAPPMQYPTISTPQSPVDETPRPIGMMPIGEQPSYISSGGESKKSDEPTYAETLIKMEDNAARKRSASFLFVAICIVGFHLQLAI